MLAAGSPKLGAFMGAYPRSLNAYVPDQVWALRPGSSGCLWRNVWKSEAGLLAPCGRFLSVLRGPLYVIDDKAFDQTGDNLVTCSYNGSTTPAGDLIAVQR
jgi:hypothetical protein